MKLNKLSLFVLILFVGLTVVSAADVADDATVAVEVPQVEQASNAQNGVAQKYVQEDNNLDETSNDISITEDVVITSENVNSYTNKNWTVESDVTVTGTDGVTLNDVAINVAGNYVTLNNLDITTSAGHANYIVNAIGRNNLTVTNSALTITNTNNEDTFGIYLKDVTGALIQNVELTVNAPSKSMNWNNYTIGEGDDAQTVWYSVPSVGAIVSDSSKNLDITNNTIAISASTPYQSGSTMPAIILRNQTNSSHVNDNTITASGSTYNYAIMCNDNVNNLDITENRITVTGQVYTAGIDASTSKGSNINYNNITATTINTIGLASNQEALSYGIILATTNQNSNNHVQYNYINLMANVGYGIENYMGANNHIEYNNITINAKRGLGIATNASNNNQYNHNKINITCNQESINNYYETIPAQNVGIIVISGNTNTISNNQINITETSTTTTTYAITLDENSANNNVNNNELYVYNTNGVTYYGNGAVNNLNILNIVNNNIPYTAPVQYAMVNKNLKKDESNPLIINIENFSDYGVMDPYGVTITLKNPNDDYIIIDSTDFNLTNVAPVLIVDGVTADNPKFKFVSENTFLYRVLFGMNAIVVDSYIPYSQINSRIQLINTVIFTSKFPNRLTLINSTILSETENILTFESMQYNTYFDSTTNIMSDSVSEGNTFVLRKYNALNNEYNNYNKPIIINKPVNITSYDYSPFSADITFIAGSEGSNITGLTLNGNLYINTSNINVKNNTINKAVIIKDASDVVVEENTFNTDTAAIEVIGGIQNTIQNNNITTTSTYTITLDADSAENTISGNNLQATELTGVDSVLDEGEDNTITDGGDEPVIVEPVLKVDTTEFTVGETTAISASIYMGDEVATDINGGKVVFKVNGKTLKDANGKVIYAKVINGTATITDYEVPSSWAKDNITIQAVYSGSSKCEALRTSANLTVTKDTPSITSSDVTASKGETVTLTATVSEGSTPVNVGKVVFKVNGKTVKDANGKVIYAKVVNGTVSVEYTIPENMKAGSYNITVSFTAPGYDKLVDTKTLTVSA
ncbi:MAG: Ig-like domain repeat protein [Methanosphaera stadtmanae]|jgi:hypothetical protein|nr:Ig-like domain repeat protein [Methanosphaera stadtmanae]